MIRKRKFQSLPTRAELLERFTYDEEAGNLLNKKTWSRSTAGSPAGGVDAQGNVIVSIGSTHFYLHELIWLVHTGIHSKYVRHKDGNKTNNRFSNLFTLPERFDQLRKEDILNLFTYDRAQGTLTRKCSYAGAKSGSIGACVNGYLKHGVLRRQIGVHVLIWFIETGAWPSEEIDHINGVRSDNRIQNLRTASRLENGRNLPMPSTNKTGITGVHFAEDRGKYRAFIREGGRSVKLGAFSDFFEAVCARKSAENKYGYHPNHGRTKEERAKTT